MTDSANAHGASAGSLRALVVRVLRTALMAIVLGSIPGVAPARAGEVRGAPAGAFDFYVLALSWSAGFCEVEGDAKGRRQCEPGARLGFTVHGLWPQGLGDDAGRDYPVFCEPGERGPPRAFVETSRDLFPEEGLARHQWRKHGGCSGASPTDYLAAVRAARDRVTIPTAFTGEGGARRVDAIEVERLFTAANPGLRADMMAVACRRGVLEEVRLCLTRDLRAFRTCPAVDRSGCRAADLAVPPVR